MEPSGINERIERIKKRIKKEYVFDEAGGVVIDMKNDLIWAVKAVAQLEAELLAHRENEGDECPLCKVEADNERLREAVKYARKQCYKHYDGDDACSCKIYNAALGDNDGG